MVFRFRFLRCAAAVLLLLGLVIAGSGSCLGGDRERTLTVGVLSYSPPWYDGAFIKERSLDLVVAGATFYFGHAELGLRDIASLVSDTSTGSNCASSAAVVVRKDRTDIQTLADLKGRTVAVVKGEPSKVNGETIRTFLSPLLAACRKPLVRPVGQAGSFSCACVSAGASLTVDY